MWWCIGEGKGDAGCVWRERVTSVPTTGSVMRSSVMGHMYSLGSGTFRIPTA